MTDDIRARAREAVGAWDHWDQGSRRFVPGVRILIDLMRGLLVELDAAQANAAEMTIRVERVRDVVAYGGDDPDCDRVDYMAVPCGDVQSAASAPVDPAEIAKVVETLFGGGFDVG